MEKVKFDKDGWIIKQVINMKIEHKNDHDRLYPKTVLEYDKSKFIVHMHDTQKNKVDGILKVVPFHETKYRGKKYEEWYKKDSGALAVVSKSIKSNKMIIVRILIPKSSKKGIKYGNNSN